MRWTGWMSWVLIAVGSALAACETEPPAEPDAAVVLDLAQPDRAQPIEPSYDAGVDAAADLLEPAPAHGTRCADALCAIEALQYCHTSDWGVSGVCVMRPAPSPGYYGCDGPEDCGGGACCLLGAASVCSGIGVCLAGGTLGDFMCHADVECGLAARCCPLGPEAPGAYRICLSGLSPADPCPPK